MPRSQVYLAKIYAQNHDADHALPLIYHLLAENYSGPLTTRILRVDPVWDPIRNDPRFRELLKKYADQQPAEAGDKSDE